jgi:ATP-dependent helicase/nuclease subunit A
MTALPVKITVSELKRRFDTGFDEESSNMYVPALIKKPMFLEESRTMSAAERGTIMHFVMQHLNMAQSDRPRLDQQLSAMVERELLTEEQAKTIDMEKKLRLLESSLGKRMAAAKLYREIPFNLELACSEIYTDMDQQKYGHHKVMLQGVIDCYFEDDDGLVLLDYKTDFIKDGSESIKQRYKVQIEYYSKALERITGKKVREKYIYLFHNGELLEM